MNYISGMLFGIAEKQQLPTAEVADKIFHRSFNCFLKVAGYAVIVYSLLFLYRNFRIPGRKLG